tara:strand:+ start:61 stop:312 length:252 start_codon:yes stop_codon:yes gene_type:complete
MADTSNKNNPEGEAGKVKQGPQLSNQGNPMGQEANNNKETTAKLRRFVMHLDKEAQTENFTGRGKKMIDECEKLLHRLRKQIK